MSGLEKINLMNYKAINDGIYSHIIKTEDEVDANAGIFDTLAKARRHLLSELRNQKEGLQYAIHSIKTVKDEELEIE